MRRMPWLPESPRTYSPLSQPRQSLQDVLAPGRRKAIGAVLQVKVAVAPESGPPAGARGALGIPEKDEGGHHRTGRARSEEGRGGEEGRTPWGPHHLKKKKMITTPPVIRSFMCLSWREIMRALIPLRSNS